MEGGVENNDSVPLREMKRQKLYRPRIVMGPSMSHTWVKVFITLMLLTH